MVRVMIDETKLRTGVDLSRVSLAAIPAVVLCFIHFALFFDKAFTIDDPAFLKQAQQIIHHPFDPFGFELFWDNRFGRASQLISSGAGMAYILVPTIASGAREWVAHLTVCGLLALGAWFMALLIRRWGFGLFECGMGALLLVSFPVVLGMAGTAMPDVPAMVFMIVAVERFQAFIDGGKISAGIICGVAFGWSAFTRSHAIIMIPVLVLLAAPGGLASLCRSFESRERLVGFFRAWRFGRLWPVCFGLVFFIVCLIVTRDRSNADISVIRSARFFAGLSYVPANLAAFFTHYTLALPLSAPWLLARWRKVWIASAPVAALAATACLWLAGDFPVHWYAVLTMSLGLMCLIDVLRFAFESDDTRVSALFVWLLVALPVCVYLHLPVKYLSLSAPAVILLWLTVFKDMRSLPRLCLEFGIVIYGVVVGLMVNHADAEMSRVGRMTADRIIAPLVESGHKVWFSGHWGFQWYAERAGACPLLEQAPFPGAGDYIVGNRTQNYELIRRLPVSGSRLMPVGSGFGPRIMNDGAGFFSNGWGYLPLTLGRAPAENIIVWRVVGGGNGDEDAK